MTQIVVTEGLMKRQLDGFLWSIDDKTGQPKRKKVPLDFVPEYNVHQNTGGKRKTPVVSKIPPEHIEAVKTILANSKTRFGMRKIVMDQLGVSCARANYIVLVVQKMARMAVEA